MTIGGLRPILSESQPNSTNQNMLNKAATPIIARAAVSSIRSEFCRKIERLELGGVPDHGEPGGDAEQGDQDHLGPLPAAEALA